MRLRGFLTREIGQEPGRNIVDDYLKRRGWKEAGAGSPLYGGPSHAVMSLMRSATSTPANPSWRVIWCAAGEPVRVHERSATQTLAPWERIGARLVPLNDQTVLAGGLLPFTFETSDALLKSLKGSMKRARRQLIRLTKGTGRSQRSRVCGRHSGHRVAGDLGAGVQQCVA